MYKACSHLSPKRLTDPAADVWSLAKHLGVRMVVASRDSVVRDWIDRGFSDRPAGMNLPAGSKGKSVVNSSERFGRLNCGIDGRNMFGVLALAKKLDDSFR